MRFFLWAIFFIAPSFLQGKVSEVPWVQEHLRHVTKRYELKLLSEGKHSLKDAIIDFEFIGMRRSDLDAARILLVSCVEHLKSLAEKEGTFEIRYGISFLDAKGELQKEGIARIATLKPKQLSEQKVFYALMSPSEDPKGSDVLRTTYVEDYEEAFKEVLLTCFLP